MGKRINDGFKPDVVVLAGDYDEAPYSDFETKERRANPCACSCSGGRGLVRPY